MGDYASVIGGNGDPHDIYDQSLKDLDVYYSIVSGGVSLNLSNFTGNNVFDTSANTHGVEILSGTGDDYMLGGRSDDTFAGGAGADTLSGERGDDILSGGAGTDEIHGGAGDDSIDGGRGDDSLYGDAGDDEIHGGAGDDLVRGGNGDDTIFGDAGDDNLLGGAGDDEIHGGNGNDYVGGAFGDDLLYGDRGDDTMDGGAGADTLVGGIGNDVFVFESRFGDDVIEDFTGGKDQIWLFANINNSGIANANDVKQYVSGNAGQTVITIGDDSITLDGVGKDDFLQHITQWVKII
ncbi:calcium-binding protein [Paracraurococcus ruber]|uniref:Uncharacterized protein n=1 Tax=Paracraurococcus ruber TaxID=77675 RepID=A0ABS1D6J4_9PROT|nr:calcium-binding protein [Paracraurococcus ruber]MBK1662513.1 hypothetical protein [Paracraurococcus ruber]TDG21644.1 calcium-binding protein [Paracraurococcus ruber]